MPLKQITFSKKYPYAQFLNYDIGYVWDMAEGETREDIEDMLLKFADDTHKKNHPHLYQEQTSTLSIQERDAVNNHLSNFTPIPTPEPEEKISPEQGRSNTIESINKCTTIKELKDWELLAKTHFDTRGAYTRKIIELTNNK